MIRNPSYWKRILILLVTGLIIFTVTIDFTDTGYPDWNLFQQSELPSATEVYGAKAAILAMAAAATLFIGFIPVNSSNRGTRVDLYVQVVGAIAVGLTGWFWLLSATNGNPGPYLVAIVPSMAVFVLAVGIFLGLRIAHGLDERQVNETGKTKLIWDIVKLGLVFLLAFALIIGAIAFVPKWLF